MTNNLTPTGSAGERLEIDDGDSHFGLAPSSFRLLVENTADGILLVDPDGAVLYANAAAARIFGRRRRDLLDVSLGRPIVEGEATEITVRRPNLSPAAVEFRVVEVEWNGEHALLANLRDVSLQRANEQRLRELQKLEALGKLAAGIAHDFRSLIMVVQAGLRLIGSKIREGGPPEDVAMLIQEIMQRTHNAEAFTGQMLTFSRKQVLSPKLVDINERILSIASILGPTLGRGISIRTELDDNVGTLEIDSDQLDVALLNLAVNARDAMDGRGTLSIATGVVAGGAASSLHLIRITITDTGVGMDAQTKARAFEPFFTTKGDGKGTGLGLSQVYGFVVQSGGQVRIDSEPGAGTRVNLLLPRNPPDPDPPAGE
ncbi:two-component system sensor histidine kinase NtrB [Xanthobacter flavus]|uniref:two-component system sensor histidine kinase NtrB n=1 Tax=Xanthobacter flavus TaxID=281 RepID=UPI00372667F3